MTIAKPIGRADLEFYESTLVMATARAMSRKSDAEWDALTTKTRLRWIDRALTVLQDVLSREAVVDRLPLLARNLSARR